MRKSGRHRGVKWASAGVDGLDARSRRRHSLLGLTSGSAVPALVIRAGGIILAVSLVFVALFGSINRGERPAEAVKMPTLVKTTHPVTEPKREEERPAPASTPSWWTTATPYPQDFAGLDAEKPADLCRRLAALGYADARWTRSDVFKGEWECSSPLDGRNGQGRGFVLVRGVGENHLNSLMLKLTAPGGDERGALAETARNAVLAFSQAARLVLSSDALPDLAEWRTGRSWTSQGTFTIAAEGGRPDTRIVSLAAIPPLPRPADSRCPQACRERFAFLAKRTAAVRRVKSERRAALADSDAKGQHEPAGLRMSFGFHP